MTERGLNSHYRIKDPVLSNARMKERLFRTPIFVLINIGNEAECLSCVAQICKIKSDDYSGVLFPEHENFVGLGRQPEKAWI